jgi:hypothetical protein
MINVIEYDSASGHEGIHLLARKFQEGWETLIPLRYHACCDTFRTTLYLPR